MSYRRIISVCLVTFWSLCMLHCMAEMASAHWHVHSSGSPHHHHDPLNGSHQHDLPQHEVPQHEVPQHEVPQHEDGGPVGGHSHDSEVSSCCQMKATLVSSTQFGKLVPGAFISQFIFLLQSILHPFLSNYASARMDDYDPCRLLHGDVSHQVLSLRIPNAPPSIAAF